MLRSAGHKRGKEKRMGRNFAYAPDDSLAAALSCWVMASACQCASAAARCRHTVCGAIPGIGAMQACGPLGSLTAVLAARWADESSTRGAGGTNDIRWCRGRRGARAAAPTGALPLTPAPVPCLADHRLKLGRASVSRYHGLERLSGDTRLRRGCPRVPFAN